MKCKATPAWWNVPPNIGLEGQRRSSTRHMGFSVSRTKLTILMLLVTLMIDVSEGYGSHWCHSGWSSRRVSTYEEPAGYSIADYTY